MIRRKLAGRQDTPPQYYQLELIAQLHDASAIEVRFGARGPLANAAADLPFALRIDGEQLTVFENVSSESAQEIKAIPHQFHETDRRYFIELQRATDLRGTIFWSVNLNGQQVFAFNAAKDSISPPDEFQLAVIGGPAWFSDLIHQELRSR